MNVEMKQNSITTFDVNFKNISKGKVYILIHALQNYCNENSEAKTILDAIVYVAKQNDINV